jgi:DnaK suppressor protein
MATTEFKHNLEMLLALRARLRGDVTQVEDNALNQDRSQNSVPDDKAELATGKFDQELALRVLGDEEDALGQIETAIEHIKDGVYGQCETCGVQITKCRLRAIPYATQCVQCASEREHLPTT